MIFLQIRPGSPSSRSPSCAWNNCIIPSKHVKTLKQGSSAEFSCFTHRDCKRPQWNKPFLNTSIFPRYIESRCTEKNQAGSLMTSTHASVRCSILVFTDIRITALRAARVGLWVTGLILVLAYDSILLTTPWRHTHKFPISLKDWFYDHIQSGQSPNAIEYHNLLGGCDTQSHLDFDPDVGCHT